MVLVASISIFRPFACPPHSMIILCALHGQINEPETFFCISECFEISALVEVRR